MLKPRIMFYQFKPICKKCFSSTTKSLSYVNLAAMLGGYQGWLLLVNNQLQHRGWKYFIKQSIDNILINPKYSKAQEIKEELVKIYTTQQLSRHHGKIAAVHISIPSRIFFNNNLYFPFERNSQTFVTLLGIANSK